MSLRAQCTNDPLYDMYYGMHSLSGVGSHDYHTVILKMKGWSCISVAL